MRSKTRKNRANTAGSVHGGRKNTKYYDMLCSVAVEQEKAEARDVISTMGNVGYFEVLNFSDNWTHSRSGC